MIPPRDIPPRDTPSRRERLFDEALVLSPEEREAFLHRACPDDPDLRDELLSLVRSHEESEGFFDALSRSWITPLGMTGSLLPDGSLLPPGSRVGRYELSGVLGEGGMGVVYRARDRELDREVALKLLPRATVADPEARAALLSEARAIARVDHPNVGVIHEVGETEDAGVFLAMACHEGETLADRLRRGPLPLPVPEVLRIGRQLASALEAAHRAGIVHRDVKPSNVLLTRDGGLRLVDFGIAAALGSTASPRGSRGYASPETMAGVPADARTDLWSLGILLHELVTGVRPPEPEQGLPALDQVAARGAVPGELVAAIRGCLEPDPGRRPGDAEALGGMLAEAEEEWAARREPRGGSGGGGVAGGPRAGEAAASPARPRSRPTAPLVAAAGLGALLLGVLGILGWRGALGGGERSPGGGAPEGGAPAVPTAASAGLVPDEGFAHRVLVLPFEDRTGDPELAPVGDVAADWLTDGISRAGMAHVVQATSALAAVRETRDPVALAGTWAATLVVTGSYLVDGDSLRFSARILDGAGGTLRRTVDPVAAPRGQPLAGIEALRRTVVSAVALEVDPNLTALERVVTVQPPAWESYLAYNRAKEHFVEGRMAPALAAAEEAEALDPDFLLPVFLGALSAANLGDFDDVQARRDRMAPRVHQADGPTRLGYDFLQAILAGSHEASYRSHRRWVDQGILVPGTMGHAQLVQDAVKLNRLREAVEVARQVDPIRGEIRSWYAFWSAWSTAHYGLGEYEEALRVARLAREVLGRARLDPLVLEVRALVALGELDAVDGVVDEALQRSASPADFLRWTGDLLEIHGFPEESVRRYDQAVALARSLLADDPSSARRAALTWALLARGTPEAGREAQALLEELLADGRDAGEDPVPWLSGLARAALLQGDTARALGYSEELGSLEGRWLFGRHTWEQARIAARMGDPDRMLDLMDRANRAGTQVHFLVRGEPGVMGFRDHPGVVAFLRPR